MATLRSIIIHKNFFKKDVSITSLLIWTNIIVFFAVNIFYCLTGSNESFCLIIGANSKDLTFNSHQYWRLISSLFIHYNFLHLTINMFALWGIGISLEKRINKTKYIITYLMTGILAGIGVMFHSNSTLGSSGAIMGLTGLLVFEKLNSSPINKPLVLRYGFPLLIGFAVEFYLSELIDVVAHLIGFLSGFVFGMLTSINKILNAL